MTGRTHDLAAATLLGAVIIVVPLPEITLSTALLALLANQIGGIVPDIDQPIAPFWRTLPIGGPIGKVITKMLGGHRFITHSLIGVAILCLLAYELLLFFQPIMPNVTIDLVWWAFVIGTISHLIMDSFTKEGVPWLLPIPLKFGFPPLRRLRVTTGKWVETLGIFPLLIAIDIALLVGHYNHLASFAHHITR
jgi:inner membrane protein